MNNHLIVMAKAPRLGRVKTRLAADVGAVAALAFYRRTLEDTVRRLAADRRWRTWLAVSPDVGGHGFPAGIPRLPQGGGDLGARMGRLMAVPPPGPVVIVGADIPDIPPDAVAGAFRALGRADAVFGPAADGGYWLVGLKRRPRLPEIFDRVRWSTPRALADTVANLPAGTGVAYVDTLADVDDGKDLRAWRARLRRR